MYIRKKIATERFKQLNIITLQCNNVTTFNYGSLYYHTEKKDKQRQRFAFKYGEKQF